MRWWRADSVGPTVAPVARGEVVKRFVVLAAVVILATVVGSAIAYGVESDNRLEAIRADESATVETASALFVGALTPVVTDVAVVASLPPWSMSVPEEAREGFLAQYFAVLTAQKGIYDQVRFIDADGREQVRFDLTADGVAQTPEARLQDKSGRYYFEETMALDAGEVFISPLDLNFENGEVEVPHTPMIRIGTPVEDLSGNRLGIVLVNYLAADLVRSVVGDLGTAADQLSLLDRDANWLRSPDPDLTWGWMLGRPDLTFAATHPGEWDRMAGEPSGQFESGLGLVSWRTFDPVEGLAEHLAERPATSLVPVRSDAGLTSWTVVSVTPVSVLDGIRTDVATVIALVAGPAAILLLVAAWFYSVARARNVAAARDRARAAAVFDATSEGIIVTDAAGVAVTVNDAFSAATGLEHDDIVGTQPEVLLPDGTGLDFAEIASTIDAEGMWRTDGWVRGSDGEPRAIAIAVSPITEEDGAVDSYVGVVSDITDRQLREARLRDQAMTDDLTGLPNRAALVDALEMASSRATHDHTKVAVLFCDLDGFKAVNDTLGHQAGDELLVAMGDRIRAAVRDADMVARLGGDEFVVLLVDLPDVGVAERAAERVIASLDRPFDLELGPATVSASIGVALCSDCETSPDDLLERADRAMYAAKRAGRSTYRIELEPPGDHARV